MLEIFVVVNARVKTVAVQYIHLRCSCFCHLLVYGFGYHKGMVWEFIMGHYLQYIHRELQHFTLNWLFL